MTVIFTNFWFAGAIAWAKAIGDIETYTNPEKIIAAQQVCIASPNSCQPTTYPTYANIIVSCVSIF